MSQCRGVVNGGNKNVRGNEFGLKKKLYDQMYINFCHKRVNS